MYNVEDLVGYFRIDDGVVTHLASPQDNFGELACAAQFKYPERNVAQVLAPDQTGNPFTRYSPLCDDCARIKGVE